MTSDVSHVVGCILACYARGSGFDPRTVQTFVCMNICLYCVWVFLCIIWMYLQTNVYSMLYALSGPIALLRLGLDGAV
jgi:hypothetical protein